MEAHFYDIDIQWNTGRQGMLCSKDLVSSAQSPGCIEVATPPEFPKGVPGIWSPEHLFTASVASCLMTTFLAIAENSKLEFDRFACHAKGKLDTVEGKFLMTEVQLFPEVVIADEGQREKALKVLEKSERACLISNSIKSKVVMEAKVTLADRVS